MKNDFPRHEEIQLSEDVVPFYIFTLITAFVLVVFGGIGWSWLMYHDVSARYGGFPTPEVMRHAPREISGVNQTLILHDRRGQRLREQQRRRIESWGWVDRNAGIVHIPIEEAIRLTVEEARNE